MARKIPADAFSFYAALGPQRSYQAVADHYHVSKRSVVTLASKEKWQQRVVELEEKARQGAEKKVGDTLEEMSARHVKMLHFIAGKALETLRAIPLDSAIDAIRALAIVIREERALRGDGNEGGDLTVEEIIKREYAEWMTTSSTDERSNHDRETKHVAPEQARPVP